MKLIKYCSNTHSLGDCPKRSYQVALNFFSHSRRDIRRIVGYVTDVATQNTDKKTSKVVSSLREIALIPEHHRRLDDYLQRRQIAVHQNIAQLMTMPHVKKQHIDTLLAAISTERTEAALVLVADVLVF